MWNFTVLWKTQYNGKYLGSLQIIKVDSKRMEIWTDEIIWQTFQRIIKELFYQIKVLGTEIPTDEFSKMLKVMWTVNSRTEKILNIFNSFTKWLNKLNNNLNKYNKWTFLIYLL